MHKLRPLVILGAISLACGGRPAHTDAQLHGDRRQTIDRISPDQSQESDTPRQCFPYENPNPNFDYECKGNIGCTELTIKKCQCACVGCNGTRCVRAICDDSCLGPPNVDIGKPCGPNASVCGTDGTCLLTAPTSGFCTMECTEDDPQTPFVNEDNCPNLTVDVCVRIPLTGGQSKSFCVKTCKPSLNVASCQSPLACLPESGHLFGLLDRAVCALPGCSGGEQCPVILGAQCDVTKPCPTGQFCVPVADNVTNGHCALPGKCNGASGLCAPSQSTGTGKVGEPCASDLDCAGPATCMMETTPQTWLKGTGEPCIAPAQCCSGTCIAGKCEPGLCGTLYRNGYCTIVGCTFASSYLPGTCPANSICNRLYPGGHCQKTCDPTSAATCRGLAADKLGDYECRNWSNIQLAPTPNALHVADGPVCDYGPTIRCSMTEPVIAPCDQLGAAANATQMSCRNLLNQVLAPTDQLGYCLDNTASGPP